VHGRHTRDCGVVGAPHYFLIGPDGRILLSKEMDWGKIAETIGKTLGDGNTRSGSNVSTASL